MIKIHELGNADRFRYSCRLGFLRIVSIKIEVRGAATDRFLLSYRCQQHFLVGVSRNTIRESKIIPFPLPFPAALPRKS